MKKIPLILFILLLLVSACGPTTQEEVDSMLEGLDDAASDAPGIEDMGLTGLEAGWYPFVNANEVRDIFIHDGVIYAATLGGMVTWRLDNGEMRKYTPMDGMGHVSAMSITACNIPEPRILVGTLEGISIFDPASGTWEQRKMAPPESRLDQSKIEHLYCDQANNRLLIGYYGLGVLDLGSGEFKQFTENEGLLWNAVSDIIVVGSDIWVASGYKGIAMISGTTVKTFSAANGMPDEWAYALGLAADGTLWVGGSSGLMSFKNNAWKMYGDGTAADLSDIHEIVIASDGTIWVATLPLGTGRLCQFDPASAACTIDQRAVDDQGIMTLALTNAGDPLYGTSKGIYLWQEGAVETFRTTDQLPSNYVDSFTSAPDGSLWVGTDGGVVTLNPADPLSTWTVYQSGTYPDMGGNWASDIAVAVDGTVWAAVINGSASRLQGGTWTAFEDIYSYNTVTVDGQNRAWFGDDGKGIIVLNVDGSLAFTLTEADGLPDDTITALLTDLNGRVWIGTGQGVAKYENETLEVVFGPDDERLPSAYIRDLALAQPGGELLIATSNAIIWYDGRETRTLVDLYDAGFGDAWLVNLACAPNGRIWAGTDKGLLHSDDHITWTMLTTDDGLLTNYISALHVDALGNAWVGGGGSNFDGGGMLLMVP